MGKIYKNGIEYGGGGGDSAGHIILDNDGTAMAEEPNLQFKGLNVTDNSTDEITEVESVGLNQDSMDDVLNASIPGNQVASNGLVYSTEEQVVGRWIDGKPLYQKTIVKNSITHNSWNTENHNIQNIDQVVNVWGGLVNPNTGGLNVGYWGTGGVGPYANRTVVELFVYYDSVSSMHKGYVTMQYTKTTD